MIAAMTCVALVSCHSHEWTAASVDESVIIRHIDSLAGPDPKASEELEQAGAFRKEALPVYLKLANQDLSLHWSQLQGVLSRVRYINGDRDAFRPIAIKSLAHSELGVSHEAVKLLGIIGTEADAPAVAAQLRRKTNDIAYYTSVVKSLAAIGTEKEIELLDEMKETGWRKEYDRFWMKVADCKKAIQARADAKKKLKVKGQNDK